MDINNTKKKFKDHVLTEIVNTPDLKVFEFRNENGSGIYFQRWIINKGALVVLGDCYSANYWWNSTGISLDFLATCGLSYFSEKCIADKDGSSQEIFDSEYAENLMKEIACNNIFDNFYELHDTHNWDDLDIDAKLELIKPIIMRESKIYEYEFNGLFCHETEADAFAFMMSSDHEFMFGSDAWEYDIRTKTPTPYFHLAALRVANEKYPNAF